MCLFWAPQKRLSKVIITELSRFSYFLQANYRQNSNIPRNIPFPIRIDGIREQAIEAPIITIIITIILATNDWMLSLIRYD